MITITLACSPLMLKVFMIDQTRSQSFRGICVLAILKCLLLYWEVVLKAKKRANSVDN